MGTGRLYVFGVFAAVLALSGLAGATSVKKSSKPGLASASQYETNNMGVDPVSDLSDAEVEQALKVAGKSSDALNRAISKSKKQKQKRAGTVRAQAKAQQRGDFVVDSYEQQMYRSMEKLGFKLRTADLHTSELEGAGGGSEAAGECVECQLPGHGGGGDKPGREGKRFGAKKVKVTGGVDSRRLPEGDREKKLAKSVGKIYCSKIVKDQAGLSFEYKTEGSASLFSSQVIATVDHNFYHFEKGKEVIKFDYVSDCEIRFYSEDGKNYQVRHFESDGIFGEIASDFFDVNRDWAVLRLTAAAPEGYQAVANTTLDVDVLPDEFEVPVEVFAYHHDLRKDLAYHSAGQLSVVRSHTGSGCQIEHTADTNGMSSGASVLYTYENGVVASLGIHSRESSGRDANCVVPIKGRFLSALQKALSK